MDRAEVVSITEEAKVPAGKFTNCLKTKESSGLERAVEEKLYAPGVGLLRDGGFKLARIEKPKVELPVAAAKAFKDAFPRGEIQKLDVDEENGVTVYDIEFENGTAEQETDIAADGTILEVTLVVDAKAVPVAAMKAIDKAAAGAGITRIESIDIRCQTKDGKAIKLVKPVTHFAAEFTKGDKKTEVVVTLDRAPVKEWRRPAEGARHRRGCHCAAQSLAKSVRGESNWDPSPGVPRSRRNTRRNAPEANCAALREVLSRSEDALGVGQGRAGASLSAATR